MANRLITSRFSTGQLIRQSATMERSPHLEYGETDEFRKDFKRLLKKFRSLEEDLVVAKVNAIELYHLRGLDNASVELMTGFCTDEVKVCKVRKFACKSLKGRGVNSGIRIIYAFLVSTAQVEFIEVYFKGEKGRGDEVRIKEYLRSLQLGS